MRSNGPASTRRRAVLTSFVTACPPRCCAKGPRSARLATCSVIATFRQFLNFAQQRLARAPSRLTFEQIDAPLVTAFLDELETRRGLSVRSRNLRLTAIHSFFRYAAFELPTHAVQIQRVLAIPSKRFTRKLVSFLSRPEVDALLAAPDRSTWSGRRDHAFILTAVQTGLRLSEMTGLEREDFVAGSGAHLRVVGKGVDLELILSFIYKRSILLRLSFSDDIGSGSYMTLCQERA